MRGFVLLFFAVALAFTSSASMTPAPNGDITPLPTPEAISNSVDQGPFISAHALRPDGSEVPLGEIRSEASGLPSSAARRGFTWANPDKNGTPPRWDKCKPIYYQINTKGIPKKMRRTIIKSVEHLGAATRLTFIRDGSTRITPFVQSNWWQSAASERKNVWIIAMTNSRRISAISPGAVGLGGSVWRTNRGTAEVFVGGVTLSKGSDLAYGFKPEPGQSKWSRLLLHELGHVMGLGHVSHKSEVMFTTLLPGMPGRYGPGDRRGFKALRALPCVSQVN